MTLNVVIQWNFRPRDYFENEFVTEFEGVNIKVNDGTFTAELSRDRFEADPEIKDRIRKHVLGMFEGVRLYSHEDFEIIGGAIHKERPDGGADVIVTPNPAGVVAATGRLDLKVIDADGNVVNDSKQERIQEKREFANLVAARRGTDQTLDEMLDSYANAVDDPDDELVHLFEIRELLAAKFGGKKGARAAIGISASKWQVLGKLANVAPLHQGRHRGKNPGDLRDASRGELDEARSIAREMIVLYTQYLNSGTA